ncbi:rhodanese-like domain-containing protein [Pelistega sp. MC2]|uniref:rhodanese-like domain-containing protein n=1 Tax=Pelistega sp. MC2 TaxID=1720297 RepID=UPI0008D99037|nr:rhodanese-like domain-containing protein [Pelistega sp. MC2]
MYILPQQLKDWLSDHHEIALLDIREHGQYGENHLFYAVSAPFSVLEDRVVYLVPRVTTRIVLYGNHAEESIVRTCMERLNQLGYQNVYILIGGVESWEAAGFNTFAGVNVPSKTFGELAEHFYHTPCISAKELYDLQHQASANYIVLDGRPLSEYQKMNIPGSICCPNGELALRATELAPDPQTTIIINCAGRTRSIIGAQSLINLGLPNPIFALENGTQGWYLADFTLEHHADRVYPDIISSKRVVELQLKAAKLSERFALAKVTVDEVHRWLDEDEVTVYLCDIRTAKEYHNSHWPSLIRHTPGGQLVQATDEFIGVRNARIVLIDTDNIRAIVTATWLKQLGWDVYLLPDDGDLKRLSTIKREVTYQLNHTQVYDEEQLIQLIEDNADLIIFDARASNEYRKVHLQNSQWIIRPLITQLAPQNKHTKILIIGDSKVKNLCLAQDFEQLGFKQIYISTITANFFHHTDLPISTDSTVLQDKDCIDFLFFVHDRHQGNKKAAQQYLAWETNLIKQIDAQEKATFHFE